MIINEMLLAVNPFTHIDYAGKPLPDAEMAMFLGLFYGCRTVKPAIEKMLNDPLRDSYLDIMGNTICSLYADKWDRIGELQKTTVATLEGELTKTTSNGTNTSTSTNSVWGITDAMSKEKDMNDSTGSSVNTTTTEKTGKIDIDNVQKINNMSLIRAIVCDVANYFALYVIE